MLQVISPIVDIVISLGKAVGMPMSDTTMNVFSNKDNAGALVLDRTFPPQFTLRIKYYETTTIFFVRILLSAGSIF